MPVRNEAWVLGLSARVALKWCDELVILCHACSDRSAEIAHEVQAEYGARRVLVVSTPTQTWEEMKQRQHMLELARNRGASHIAIVDADEILTGNLLPLSQGLWIAAQMLQLPGYNLRCTPHRYHTNGVWGKRWFSLTFADNERLHWWKEERSGSYDHHHREPYGMTVEPFRPVSQGNGGIMHLWGVTEKRLIAKHALYKMSEALKWPDKNRADIDHMYTLAIKGTSWEQAKDWQYARVPDEWWEPYKPLLKHLDLNAEPWQIEYCKRLLDKHGREAFAGLDLFGVV